MSNPTISIPRSQKRWPISTIFTPENMHAIFVPPSCRHPFNSRFICGNSWRTIIPPSFHQDFPTTYQSTNSKISQLSQLSQFSRLSHLSRLSPPSQKFHPSPPSSKIHGLFNDNSWRHQKSKLSVCATIPKKQGLRSWSKTLA